MRRRDLFGISIHAATMEQAVAHVLARVRDGQTTCRYVVTPNVDHAVMLQTHQGLREAYQSADLVLADGFPIVWASRLLGRPLPERVTGSDLVPHLFAAVPSGQTLTVFLLGAAPGVAARAAENIARRWPRVRVVGTNSPPLGFENDAATNAQIVAEISAAKPDVLILGLGAPKQECWIHRHQSQLAAGVALCVGATIDFLAGEKKRAPHWMQSCGLEWAYRMCSEPRRLVRRYAKDAWVFPQLFWKQWRAQQRAAR